MSYARSQPGVISAGELGANYKEPRIKTIDTGYAQPGRLVIRDTDDDHCRVAGAGSAVVTGFLMPVFGYDSATDFVTEQKVKVGRGTCVVTLYLTTGQTVIEGDDLFPAAHGALEKTATGSERPVGKADESVTTSTLAESPIRVRWNQ